MKTRGLAVAVAACALALAAPDAPAQPRETPLAEGRRALTVQGERYGALSDDHATTRRVRDVFDGIVRAAGRRPGLALELHVLDTPRVIVEALRGGLVVISRGAVDLARGDENALAFLLAHEIAHHTRDHHALLESLGVLGAAAGPVLAPAAAAPRSAEVVRTYRAVELDADRLGVLYAALAGYRAASAVPVLTLLIERTGPDLFHPDPRDRARAIRDQIGEVADHLEVFHLGLYLLAVGRPLDAARVLEHFLALFPSREVLAAVGVAYHREALRYAPPPPFRHVLVVDAATRAPATRGAPHPVFKQFLDRAVHYYTLAVDADPAYAPARNNLGAAYLDLGERELALGHIYRAVQDGPRLAAALNNRGVAWAMASDWTRAEEDWLAAARLDPGVRQSAHNLARLYEARGRADEARRWAPPPAALERAGGAEAAESVGGLAPGTPVSHLAEWVGDPGVRQIRVPLGAGRDLTLLVFSRRGLALVTQNNVVEFVGTLPQARAATARGVRPGDTAGRLESAYGRAAGLDGLQALQVWAYPARPLAAFVVNDRVQALWAGRPSGDSR
jgi:tetratricopeptide (TPR) repeat protein